MQLERYALSGLRLCREARPWRRLEYWLDAGGTQSLSLRWGCLCRPPSAGGSANSRTGGGSRRRLAKTRRRLGGHPSPQRQRPKDRPQACCAIHRYRPNAPLSLTSEPLFAFAVPALCPRRPVALAVNRRRSTGLAICGGARCAIRPPGPPRGPARHPWRPGRAPMCGRPCPHLGCVLPPIPPAAFCGRSRGDGGQNGKVAPPASSKVSATLTLLGYPFEPHFGGPRFPFL